MPSLPERPVGQINDIPPGTWDTMPSSGMSQFYRYKDSQQPHGQFSVQDFYYVGIHDDEEKIPLYVDEAFLERDSNTPSHAKMVVPIPANFVTTFWTLVHVIWIPHQMRQIGTVHSAHHVLSLPLSQYLASLHKDSDSRKENTIPLDDDGNYTNDDGRFMNGIVDIPTFKGYQLISERFVFQSAIAAADQSFRLHTPTLTVRASSNVVKKWSAAIAAVAPNIRIPQLYGALTSNQHRMDQANVPRLTYRTSAQVQVPSQPRDQFGVNLATSFDNVWPAQGTFDGTTLSPAFHERIHQTTGFYGNTSQGLLLEISISQFESNSPDEPA